MWEIELHPEQTIFFPTRIKSKQEIKETYANAVCDYRPLKYDPHCVRLAIGGDRLIYPGDPSAPAASLLESKIFFNTTISTPGAQCFCANIKYYFLNNPMTCYEYMKIELRWFSQDIIDQYKIIDLVNKDGFVYINIRNGLYCLKQAARIAFDHLVKLLKPHGHYPLRSNASIWCYETLPSNLHFLWTLLG